MTRYVGNADLSERLETEFSTRYMQQPCIEKFAHFDDGKGKNILEIGVGLGSDHLRWRRSSPLRLVGIDLSERAIWYTRQRLKFSNLRSELIIGDAENLPFDEGTFDIIYSWGVLHHSPDTNRAINEVKRVLRPGGTAKIMVYHKHSLTGLMLWLRYGLLTGRLWLTLRKTYALYLESQGTKAFTLSEVDKMFQDFSQVDKEIAFSHGDLMIGKVGRRHQGLFLSIARIVWPRWFFRTFVKRSGLFLMIIALK